MRQKSNEYEKCALRFSWIRSAWHRNCSHISTHNRYQKRCKTSQNVPANILCRNDFISCLFVGWRRRGGQTVDNMRYHFCLWVPFKSNERQLSQLKWESNKNVDLVKGLILWKRMNRDAPVPANWIYQNSFDSFRNIHNFILLGCCCCCGFCFWLFRLTDMNIEQYEWKTTNRNRCKHVLPHAFQHIAWMCALVCCDSDIICLIIFVFHFSWCESVGRIARQIHRPIIRFLSLFNEFP